MNRICARVQKRPPMAPFNGFGKRMPSEAPPVLTPSERDKLKAQAEADGQVAVGGGPIPTNPGSSNGNPEGNR
jgi:cell division protease FtsH